MTGHSSAGVLESSQGKSRFRGIPDDARVFEEVDPETGELVRYYETANGVRREYKTPQQIRAERYALKSVVNRLFSTSPTAKCSRARVPKMAVVLKKVRELSKSFYTGLRRCSSVWWCPLCAAKISERRRAELVAAVATARAMGWNVYLMTCTIPHGLGDDIKAMLKQMKKAWRKMTDDRKGKELRKLLGLRGTIRTLEVTDGENGFHPHYHALLFLDSEFSPESVQAGFLPLWQEVCVSVGLPCPSDLHGLKVDDGSWAAKYASKWGLEDEMVKGHIKIARAKKGKTPWDFLRDILHNESRESEARFRLYAEAFKGERQLYWSNGLAELLGVERKTDPEIMAESEEHAFDFHTFTEDQWRAVLVTQSEAVLQDVCEEHPEDFKAVLDGIVAMYKALRGKRQP